MKLKDKIAVVTGAGAGMGRAVAHRYAQEGATVIVVELNEIDGKETVAQIVKGGGKAALVVANVGNELEVKDMVSYVMNNHARIDILYNNVARMHPRDARVHEVDSAVWLELVNTNLNSAFYCAKHCLTEMIRTGGGSLIFVGSPTAMVACAPFDAAYSCTKAGVHTLARVIAGAYGDDRIRANVIIPGTMDTPMIKDILADEQRRQELTKTTMLHRLGNSDDVTGLAVFLASEDSSYCTGAVFTADGGLTAM